MLPPNIQKHGFSSLYLKRFFFINKSIINIEWNSIVERKMWAVLLPTSAVGKVFLAGGHLSKHADRSFFGLPRCSCACKIRGLGTSHSVYQNDGLLLG